MKKEQQYIRRGWWTKNTNIDNHLEIKKQEMHNANHKKNTYKELKMFYQSERESKRTILKR